MDLIKVRITAFLYEAGAFIATGILGALVSPEFSNLVTEHFGETAITSVVLLGISALVKHLRNLKVLKKHELGGAGDKPPVLI